MWKFLSKSFWKFLAPVPADETPIVLWPDVCHTSLSGVMVERSLGAVPVSRTLAGVMPERTIEHVCGSE